VYAVSALRALQQIFQIGYLSQDRVKAYLGRIRTTFPHAYNLLQVAAEIVHDKKALRHVAELPHHYTANQVEAIENRFESDNTLIKSALSMVYCDVCGTDYSLRRQFKSNFKQRYAIGLRDVLVKYTTNEKFCRNNKVNHRGRCGEKPLKELFLLGQAVEFNSKTLLLCPQEGCAMPMVLERSDLQRKALETKKQQMKGTKRKRELITSASVVITPTTPVPMKELISQFKKIIEIPKKKKKLHLIRSYEYKIEFANRIQMLDDYRKKMKIWEIPFSELSIPLEPTDDDDTNRAYATMLDIIRDLLDSKQKSKRPKTRCIYNERGIACCDCTVKFEQKTGVVEQMKEQWKHVLDFKNLQCALCTFKFQSLKQIHWYNFDLLLCPRHSTKGMRASAREYISEQGVNITKDGLLQKMIQHKRDHSRFAEARCNSVQAKKALQRAKARHRQCTKR
jgi:hypothetical protein